MRLINVRTLELQTFGDNPPAYAILSHRWCEHELSYQDFVNPENHHGPGFAKILAFCRLVSGWVRMPNSRPTGYNMPDSLKVRWAWVDTVCIDKTSSAELSEAINSMWEYYRRATYCIAFLGDVSTSNDVEASEWFTRGWTLQELLAPQFVIFFNQNWQRIGSRGSNRTGTGRAVCRASGVEACFLDGSMDIKSASVAQRMSWAARRKTTREEDAAYSLLGLFDINMPLLYGEGGRKAFLRLQSEIIKQSDDESIFAFSVPETSGALAESPWAFRHSGSIRRQPRLVRTPYTITHLGVQIDGPSICIPGDFTNSYVLKLNCVRILRNPTTEGSKIPTSWQHDSIPAGQGLVLAVERIDQICYRRPDLEKEMLRMTSAQIHEELRQHRWEQLESRRFYIALSAAESQTLSRDSDSVVAIALKSEPPPARCLDAEGPWFLGSDII